MGEIQVIRAGGQELVVLSRADYEALVEAAEEAADIRAVEETRAALARGDEELVPAEMVDRMLAGESPVRVWREHRGLRNAELAAAAGISAAYLSQIEAGARRPGVATLRRLAEALGLSLDDLAD